MDVSIFIGNKRRFWSWILVPLFVRLFLSGIVFSVTTQSLDRFAKESKAAEMLPKIKAQTEENRGLLEKYESNPIFPVNEQLYQTVAEYNAKWGVELAPEVGVAKTRGRSKKKDQGRYTNICKKKTYSRHPYKLKWSILDPVELQINSHQKPDLCTSCQMLQYR